MVVVAGFGVLHSQKLDNYGTSTEPVVLDTLYPGSVITVDAFTAYSFWFDVSADLCGSFVGEVGTEDTWRHTLGPIIACGRAQMCLQAMAAYAQGEVRSEGAGVLYSFPTGKYVHLDLLQESVAYGGVRYAFEAANLGEVLTGIRKYLSF